VSAKREKAKLKEPKGLEEVKQPKEKKERTYKPAACPYCAKRYADSTSGLAKHLKNHHLEARKVAKSFVDEIVNSKVEAMTKINKAKDVMNALLENVNDDHFPQPTMLMRTASNLLKTGFMEIISILRSLACVAFDSKESQNMDKVKSNIQDSLSRLSTCIRNAEYTEQFEAQERKARKNIISFLGYHVSAAKDLAEGQANLFDSSIKDVIAAINKQEEKLNALYSLATQEKVINIPIPTDIHPSVSLLSKINDGYDKLNNTQVMKNASLEKKVDSLNRTVQQYQVSVDNIKNILVNNELNFTREISILTKEALMIKRAKREELILRADMHSKTPEELKEATEDKLGKIQALGKIISDKTPPKPNPGIEITPNGLIYEL
jgi:hypothetical protein